MIKYVKGDATSPQGDGKKVIAHICNDIGAWGAGFVLALSKKWKHPENVYKSCYRSGLVLGDIQIATVAQDIVVINMIAQSGIYTKLNDKNLPPIRYDALERCLEKVNQYCIDYNATLHAPRFGAGLAGGDWNEIEKIINSTMSVPVIIYDFN
jgi:O-acetyl-ADP-ribose deacetylase (regulator of RNase III)